MSTVRPAAGTANVSTEDYVKTIYSLGEWDDEPVMPSMIAQRLGVSAASVTGMVNKLVDAGLVDHEKYGAITLTGEGRERALGVVRKHRIIEAYLSEHLGYAWDEVHDEAERLEHVASDHLVEAMCTALGHPTRDPHGDPIPDHDGRIELPDLLRLTDLTGEAGGTVARISDRQPDLLRLLRSRGVDVGMRVRVTATGGPVVLRVADGGAIELGPDEAAGVWIEQG